MKYQDKCNYLPHVHNSAYVISAFFHGMPMPHEKLEHNKMLSYLSHCNLQCGSPDLHLQSRNRLSPFCLLFPKIRVVSLEKVTDKHTVPSVTVGSCFGNSEPPCHHFYFAIVWQNNTFWEYFVQVLRWAYFGMNISTWSWLVYLHPCQLWMRHMFPPVLCGYTYMFQNM